MRTEAGAVVVVCHYFARVFQFTERCGQGDGVCVMGGSKNKPKGRENNTSLCRSRALCRKKTSGDTFAECVLRVLVVM